MSKLHGHGQAVRTNNPLLIVNHFQTIIVYHSQHHHHIQNYQVIVSHAHSITIIIHCTNIYFSCVTAVVVCKLILVGHY